MIDSQHGCYYHAAWTCVWKLQLCDGRVGDDRIRGSSNVCTWMAMKRGCSARRVSDVVARTCSDWRRWAGAGAGDGIAKRSVLAFLLAFTTSFSLTSRSYHYRIVFGNRPGGPTLFSHSTNRTAADSLESQRCSSQANTETPKYIQKQCKKQCEKQC